MRGCSFVRVLGISEELKVSRLQGVGRVEWRIMYLVTKFATRINKGCHGKGQSHSKIIFDAIFIPSMVRVRLKLI